MAIVILSLIILSVMALSPIVMPLKGLRYFVKVLGYRRGIIFTVASAISMAIATWTPLIVAIVEVANGIA